MKETLSQNPSLCPLCGGGNQCGIAAGQKTCWCFNETFPDKTKAAVALSEKERACICQACLKKLAEKTPG